MRNYKPTEFVSAMLHSDAKVTNEGSKTCVVCHELKELKEFVKRPRGVDGRCSTCKSCASKKAIALYHKKKSENDIYKDFMPI